jgi:hypothetical protein
VYKYLRIGFFIYFIYVRPQLKTAKKGKERQGKTVQVTIAVGSVLYKMAVDITKYRQS